MRSIFLAALFILLYKGSLAQSIGIGTTTPNTKAALEIRSLNKGLLMPRLDETVRLGMTSVPAGLVVYDNSAGTFFYHDGGKWRRFSDFNSDSILLDYSTAPQVTGTMSINVSTSALSGILYDAGGPAGNYPNNSYHQYTVNIGGSGGNDSTVYFKVQLEEMSLEDPVDYIEFFTDDDHPLRFSGNEFGTFYLPATDNLTFRFVSNGTNTQAGFKIRWSQLLGPKAPSPPLYGWHMDHQRRAARGGVNVRNEWADPGILSFGFGANTKATGRNSIALGAELEVTGSYSASIGYRNTVSGSGSVVLGQQSSATGHYSFAAGFGADATGSRSYALGENTDAAGNYSLAAGQTAKARGIHSFALGRGTVAKGYGFAIGHYNDTTGNISNDSWVNTEPLLTIGNGQSPIARSNAVVILKNGKTGIGTNTPFTKLHIDGGGDASLSNNSGYFVIGDVTSTNIVFDNNEIQARDDGSVSTLFLQNSGGALETGGTASKPGGGSWLATSDARLKHDISPYTDGLDKLIQIKPVLFNYNALSGYDTRKQYIGVLAQELQQVAPYMIDSVTKNNDNYLTVDNSPMIYMLVNAVKDLLTEVNDLKHQVAEMETRKKSRRRNK